MKSFFLALILISLFAGEGNATSPLPNRGPYCRYSLLNVHLGGSGTDRISLSGNIARGLRVAMIDLAAQHREVNFAEQISCSENACYIEVAMIPQLDRRLAELLFRAMDPGGRRPTTSGGPSRCGDFVCNESSCGIRPERSNAQTTEIGQGLQVYEQ